MLVFLPQSFPDLASVCEAQLRLCVTLARERSKCITVGATFFSVRSELPNAAFAAQLVILLFFIRNFNLIFYVKKPLFSCRILWEKPNIENRYIRFFFWKIMCFESTFFSMAIFSLPISRIVLTKYWICTLQGAKCNEHLFQLFSTFPSEKIEGLSWNFRKLKKIYIDTFFRKHLKTIGQIVLI